MNKKEEEVFDASRLHDILSTLSTSLSAKSSSDRLDASQIFLLQTVYRSIMNFVQILGNLHLLQSNQKGEVEIPYEAFVSPELMMHAKDNTDSLSRSFSQSLRTSIIPESSVRIAKKLQGMQYAAQSGNVSLDLDDEEKENNRAAGDDMANDIFDAFSESNSKNSSQSLPSFLVSELLKSKLALQKTQMRLQILESLQVRLPNQISIDYSLLVFDNLIACRLKIFKTSLKSLDCHLKKLSLW